MRAYHHAWLRAHPHRGTEWLKRQIADGFEVHHIDGNRENNDPLNLVLIEWTDHAMLHGKRLPKDLGDTSPSRRGGLNRMRSQTPEQRKALASRAVHARWTAHRKRMKAEAERQRANA